MVFSELYSAYYNTVAKIITEAIKHPLSDNELQTIIEKHAFSESMLNIIPAFKEERWQLLKPDGETTIKNVPTMPLTTLQKRWLKAIFMDKRIKLFTDKTLDFTDVEPLFKPEDIIVFDKYADGDPFSDEVYIKNFRLILDAIKKRYPLDIETTSRNGEAIHIILMPEYLEYSEKDDKFRLTGSGEKFGSTVNLSRIISVKTYNESFDAEHAKKTPLRERTVIFELVDKRNALERVLLHFAHFKKQAEKLDDERYRITVSYDKDDEMEIVIRILSFGPMIRVTAPQHFIELIKKRLINQKSCEL